MIQSLCASRAAELLMQRDNITLLCHRRPDGDTLSVKSRRLTAPPRMRSNTSFTGSITKHATRPSVRDPNNS